MKNLIMITVFGSGVLCQAGSPEIKEFNKKCPTPRLCETMSENLEKCEKGSKKNCGQFVDNFRKALPEYDCQRSFDKTDTVSAIWLCDNHEHLLSALSKMKTTKAKKLYGSQELRATLDGDLAEQHLEASKKVEKKLKKEVDRQ